MQHFWLWAVVNISLTANANASDNIYARMIEQKVAQGVESISVPRHFDFETIVVREVEKGSISCTLQYEETIELTPPKQKADKSKQAKNSKDKKEEPEAPRLIHTGKIKEVPADGKDCDQAYLDATHPGVYTAIDIIHDPARMEQMQIRRIAADGAQQWTDLKQSALRREERGCYIAQLQAFHEAYAMMKPEQKAVLRENRSALHFTLAVHKRTVPSLKVSAAKVVKTDRETKNNYVYLYRIARVTATLNPETGECGFFTAKDILNAYFNK
jgi:hypothetical protein